jgi:predicted glycosyltransferase involved in capsule biosynthesis
VGGIVMLNKQRFIEAGMYNEKFVSWGAEDNELDRRTQILGHKQFRTLDQQSICFHMFHRQAMRSNNPYYRKNVDEAVMVDKMSKTDLQTYIKTWPWLNQS